jgi:nucleoside-diphosphate-sugar epimerase
VKERSAKGRIRRGGQSSSPRVLIAGCGYLGQATADLFWNAGWQVEGWTVSAVSAQKLSAKPYVIHVCDISDRKKVGERPESFDAVIHCASTRGGDVDLYRQVYLEGVRNLLQHFARSTIIFVGSTSVYPQTGGEWVTEHSATEPKHERGKILRAAEDLVLNRGGIVARLAGIYGPERSYLLQRFLSGEAIIDSQNDRFVNQVHRDDAAAALFLLVDQAPRIAGQAFNVVDDQPILQSECYRWLAAKLNRPVPPIGQSASEQKRGRSNKRVSNAKLRGLGWTPRYPNFAEAMEKTILPSFASV